MRYRAAVNGNRDITVIAQAPRLTFGVRGSAAGWEFDSAVLHSASQVREHNNDGWPVLTKLLPLLNSGTVNFFGDNTPAVQAQLRASNFHGDAYTISSSLSSVNGRATHELLALPGGPLALAFGVEVRQEHFRFNPSKEISEGDIAGYGGSLAYTNRSRDVDAVFAELNLPITKTLEANAAVRHDRYQGVGRSTTPKLSLRWQPVPALLLRGAVGKGFRAPSLADLFTHTTTGVSLQGLTDPIRCPTTEDPIRDCQTQFATTNGGNVALKPETAQNTTFGLVFEPVKGASVSLDFFAINLKNAISNGVPATSILGDPAKYAAYLIRGPFDPAFPALPGTARADHQHRPAQPEPGPGAAGGAGFRRPLENRRWRLGPVHAGPEWYLLQQVRHAEPRRHVQPWRRPGQHLHRRRGAALEDLPIVDLEPWALGVHRRRQLAKGL